MDRLPLILRWLAIAAAAEWLIGRTLTRAAIYIPKSEAALTAFRALTSLGQMASTFAGLLALIAILWIARRGARSSFLSLVLLGMVGLSLLSMFVPLAGWTSVVYHLITLAGIASVVWLSPVVSWPEKSIVVLAALSVGLGSAYLLLPSFGGAARLEAISAAATPLFAAGEIAFLLVPIAAASVHGRSAPRWAWAAGALLALIFGGMRLSQPAMTAILSMWSSGLSLYLPWPLYSLALGLGLVAVIAGMKGGRGDAWAVILLAASGHVPQLTTQVFYGLAALWILAAIDQDPADSRAPLTSEAVRRAPHAGLSQP